MPFGTDVIYRYDGTFEGFFSCVFESFERREIPCEIWSPDTEQMSLYTARDVDTDPEKAARVMRGIKEKISQDAFTQVAKGFLTCHPQKEVLMLNFLHLGFRHGRRVMDMLADDTVNTLFKAVLHLNREVHLYLGFVRFSIYEGNVLAAEIEPKNQVLPLIKPHFCSRLAQETFLIYDRTHRTALIYKPYEAQIIPADTLELPEADAEELKFRSLWKTFYDTIGIEERFNPRCRMSHMPKRYWRQMTEFADQYPALLK